MIFELISKITLYMYTFLRLLWILTVNKFDRRGFWQTHFQLQLAVINRRHLQKCTPTVKKTTTEAFPSLVSSVFFVGVRKELNKCASYCTIANVLWCLAGTPLIRDWLLWRKRIKCDKLQQDRRILYTVSGKSTQTAFFPVTFKVAYSFHRIWHAAVARNA